MKVVAISYSVDEIKDQEGKVSYYPLIHLGGSKSHISEQGAVVSFETKEEAEEYLQGYQ